MAPDLNRAAADGGRPTSIYRLRLPLLHGPALSLWTVVGARRCQTLLPPGVESRDHYGAAGRRAGAAGAGVVERQNSVVLRALRLGRAAQRHGGQSDRSVRQSGP